MNIFLLLSALLTCILAFGHSWLGDKYILSRLYKLKELPKLFGSDDFMKRTIRFTWHLTSIAWWGIAAMLICLALGTSQVWIIRIIAITFWLSAILSFVGSQGRHISWIIFLLITVMAWLGA